MEGWIIFNLEDGLKESIMEEVAPGLGLKESRGLQ